ncbi:MAG: nucleotidyltransferase family protein [Gammaproteobacteria bacterium]|nr:nucleotidyltransferase family protein [Gammaproteobacteria bacterium]
MHRLIERHRQKILALAIEHGFDNVRVFGSMARGDAGDDSDVDLLVTAPDGTSGLALGGLLMDVSELLGRKVDVVTDRALHPALRDRILREAVSL